MKLVIATHNKDKVKEIKHILAGLDVDVLTLDDFPGAPETVEDGETLEANALKKAREIREFTGASALSDDTGLFVDALGGAPGIYAARYAGDDATYADNCNKLLDEMSGVPDDQRAVRFRTVIALALSPRDSKRVAEYLAANPEKSVGVSQGTGRDADALISEGILPGRITRKPRGTSGFGYDPVFEVIEGGKTLAELTADEKNAMSHRYRALVEMRELLIGLELVKEM